MRQSGDEYAWQPLCRVYPFCNYIVSVGSNQMVKFHRHVDFLCAVHDSLSSILQPSILAFLVVHPFPWQVAVSMMWVSWCCHVTVTSKLLSSLGLHSSGKTVTVGELMAQFQLLKGLFHVIYSSAYMPTIIISTGACVCKYKVKQQLLYVNSDWVHCWLAILGGSGHCLGSVSHI